MLRLQIEVHVIKVKAPLLVCFSVNQRVGLTVLRLCGRKDRSEVRSIMWLNRVLSAESSARHAAQVGSLGYYIVCIPQH